MSADGAVLGARLREHDLSAAPAALNLLESNAPADRREAARCSPPSLRRARRRGGGARRRRHRAAGGWQVDHAVGVDGGLARRGRTVALLAVDPSSRRSGGSLLGDRARIEFDAADRGVLIRSTRGRRTPRRHRPLDRAPQPTRWPWHSTWS